MRERSSRAVDGAGGALLVLRVVTETSDADGGGERGGKAVEE